MQTDNMNKAGLPDQTEKNPPKSGGFSQRIRFLYDS
jgi:hypothetical protein